MACKTKMSLIAFPSQANRYQNSRTRTKTNAQEATEEYKIQLIRLLWSMIIDNFYTYIYIHRHNLMISNYINIRGYYQTAANSSRFNNGIYICKDWNQFSHLKVFYLQSSCWCELSASTPQAKPAFNLEAILSHSEYLEILRFRFRFLHVTNEKKKKMKKRIYFN